ncbi:MAG: hypothetical protein ACPLY9_01510 [Nitrososphaerales archaeon]
MLLEFLLLASIILAPLAASSLSDRDISSETHESHESIRVYPSQRRAIRYYNGEREEYEY